MHSDWQQYLTAAGACLEDGRVAHFGDPEAERRAALNGTILADLSPLALIRVSGQDASAFLNAQLTNDLRTLDPSSSRLAALCTPQGRMVAIVRVCKRDESLFLVLPRNLRDTLIARLKNFVLRSKVALEPVEDLILLGLAGPAADSLVGSVLGVAPPVAASTCATHDGITALRSLGERPRYELIVPLTKAASVWDTIQNGGAQPVSTDVWDWLEIDAGVPIILPETMEKFIPQTANLEIVDGVSFNKGCYPGQEIVARVHYLGRLKERMYVLHLSGEDAPRVGDAIYAPDLGAQATGTVVRAQRAPTGGYDLLAVVHLSSIENGELHWRSPDGPRLLVRDTQPYRLSPTH